MYLIAVFSKIFRHHLPDGLVLAFCRLGCAGLSPILPGTCGSLLATLAAPFLFLPLSLPLRVAVLLVLFWLGALAATRAERLLGQSDPSEVVIDELVGVWMVLLPLQVLGWRQIFTVFVLFRFFDMCKFWPVRASEGWLPAGYGVMIDDIFAACQTLLILAGLRLLGWF